MFLFAIFTVFKAFYSFFKIVLLIGNKNDTIMTSYRNLKNDVGFLRFGSIKMHDGKVELDLLEEMDEARGFIAENKYRLAIETLKKSLYMIDGDDYYLDKVINIYKLLGLCYRKLKMYDDGIHILNVAEELSKKELFKKKDEFWKRELAVCYVNKAIIYDAKECLREAVAYYENAIIIFEELNDDESKVKVMLSLKLLYNKMDRPEDAELICKEALSLIESNCLLGYYKSYFNNIKE